MHFLCLTLLYSDSPCFVAPSTKVSAREDDLMFVWCGVSFFCACVTCFLYDILIASVLQVSQL